jgi:hypothetical protein
VLFGIISTIRVIGCLVLFSRSSHLAVRAVVVRWSGKERRGVIITPLGLAERR